MPVHKHSHTTRFSLLPVVCDQDICGETTVLHVCIPAHGTSINAKITSCAVYMTVYDENWSNRSAGG